MEHEPIRWRPLDADLGEALVQGLDFTARLARAERPLSAAALQRLYDAFIDESIEDADAIISLGLSFGESIIQSGHFEWVRVSDEWGDETALAVLDKALYCHPISMIQKRLRVGERISIAELRESTILVLLERAEQSDKRPPPDGFD